jgi:membrane-bound lytic murein transglycosylase D
MRIKIFILLFTCLQVKSLLAETGFLLLADTIITDTSIAPLPADDPRSAFRGLFVKATDSPGDYSVEMNPRAISFVQDYMIRHTRSLTRMKDWGRPYFDMMDGILRAHGLPQELKYLAVIESDLKSSALSWAGAVGPWQFMPATARRMGLRVDQYVDERTDYYKSTHAAARYLTELFGQYGDWLLVIAAYNGGAGNVNSAIRKSNSHDFWDLQYYLPEESRNHVKKFIATHYIMEGNGGITTVTKEEARDIAFAGTDGRSNLTADELADVKTIAITGKYSSLVITKNISMDLANFNRYNPDFDRQVGINGAYALRLPPDKMDIFIARKYQILDESLRLLLAPRK